MASRKIVNMDKRGNGEELREAEGRETVIKIY